MNQFKNDDNLCSTCRNQLECNYPKIQGRRIDYCTEHEACEACEGESSLSLLKPPSSILRTSRVTASGSVNMADDSVPSQGLCLNCENREDCTYPKPPGGVWHCEECLFS
jgi:hypothetical protein